MSPANPLPRQDLELILEHTAQLWEEVRASRIFLTGGTGFFGCWLVESFCFVNNLLGLGAAITILTRNPDAFAKKCPHLASDPAVMLHAGDVRSFALPEGEYQYVIHAATEASAKQAVEAPLETFSAIIAGTERTLEFAATHGARKFLLTSSGAVYGKQPADLTHVPESYTGTPDPLDPANVYAEGKRAAELLCALYQKTGGIECKIARCWAFCGPHLPFDQHFAIGNFIGDVLAGRSIQIKGDGTPRRSYLYAADLCIWLWTILFGAPALVPINVGSAHDVSILELARTVATTLNPQTEIRVAQEVVAGAAPLRYVPCVDRAREILGLCQTIGLEECIRRTANWYGESNNLA
ncbi:MAG TPA: NAD-dependent epimerase/dehydratase family protein [Candidatus Dormibacteraeota bacterium]|jgi:nucleoside-diphosphate-sugar epimerase|nr:NAD-dependent epimerase/dehydratase family protein [Candidatus Dormibacteraeota bacterium]